MRTFPGRAVPVAPAARGAANLCPARFAPIWGWRHPRWTPWTAAPWRAALGY